MNTIEYIIKRFDGDYAVLVTASGDKNRVARALLPEDVNEGDHIIYRDFVFSKE